MDVRALRSARRTAVRPGHVLLLAVLSAAVVLAGCASGSSSQNAGTPHSGAMMSTPMMSTPMMTEPMMSASSHRPAGTVQRTFQPYGSSGRLTVPVAKRIVGHCWEISLAAPTPHTFRCLSNNQILDPCFVARTEAHDVACFADPWSKAELLRLTQPLPNSRLGATMRRAWAFVLAAGSGPLRCVAVTGTAPFVNGVGLGYACGNGSYAALRMSPAGRATAVVGRPNGHTLQTLPVTTIWQG